MGYNGSLEEVIKQFCDEKWGMSPGETTASRFAKELEWFRGMVKEYAEFFGKTEDEMVAEMEEKRSYSWPNYYQPANFPSLKSVKDDPHLVGIFKTRDDFAKHCKENYVGFRCPKCGNVGRDPQACEHRKAGDGVCDWCATGLFTSEWFIMILELGYNKIHIFEPVGKDDGNGKISGLNRIRRDVERNYATCYWNEGGLTKDGRVPREHTIEPEKFLERVAKACMRDHDFSTSALRRVQSLIGTALGQDPEDARDAIEEIERIVDKALRSIRRGME